MLRFHGLLCLGLACAFVLPATLAGNDEPVAVTLEKTVRSLEHLAGVEQRLQQRDASAIHAVIAATEPATTSDPAARDAELDRLRNEVVALQGRVEGDAPAAATSTSAPDAPTTGLDLQRLRALTPQAVSSSKTPEKQAFEGPEYAADSLRLAHAYYREGALDRALLLFETGAATSESNYWRARCLERLGRTAEALDAYARLAATPSAGWHAERAREDLEFLRWRLALERAATERKGGKP